MEFIIRATVNINVPTSDQLRAIRSRVRNLLLDFAPEQDINVIVDFSPAEVVPGA